MPARVLKVLKTTAEETLHRAFVSGCLVNPNLQTVDELSKRYVAHFLEDKVEVLAAENVQDMNVPNEDALPENVDTPIVEEVLTPTVSVNSAVARDIYAAAKSRND